MKTILSMFLAVLSIMLSQSINAQPKITSGENSGADFKNVLLAVNNMSGISEVDFSNSVLLYSSSSIQQRKITGMVKEKDGTSMPGVNVVVTGTTQGVITDVNGNFAIEIPQGSKSLTFTFIGMQPQEVAIGASNEITVTMSQSAIDLEEVVVIGYGTVRKSDLTGSVSSVKSEAITLQAVGNPVQALAGVVSGVQVLQTSGQPGSALSVLIRGGNSLLGSNEPLYIVDGMPLAGGLGMLNTNDIQSIEILKDASATAIYGSRSANGVVLITTKKGSSGKTSVEYSAYLGIQQASKTIDLLNGEEYATIANIRAANDGEAPYFTPAQVAAFGQGTDWQAEIFQLAPIQNHSLRVYGGNDKTIFSISGNYFDQKGIIVNTGYKNTQLRTSVETKLMPNWRLSLNSIISRRENKNLLSNNTERGRGVLSAALADAPTIPVRDAEGKYTSMRPYGFSPEAVENAVALALERKQQSHSNNLNLNVFTDGNIFKDLRFYSGVGIQYESTRGDLYSPPILLASQIGLASISYAEFTDIVNENTLTYSKKIGTDHEFTALAGVTAQINTSQSVYASSTGFLTNMLENYSLQSGSYVGTPESGYSKYTLLSYLGRVNYSFKGKYLLTASIRADGSSRFGAENKWGYFPSAAFAWRVSDEDFLMDNPTLSNLKLRASWGQTGSTAVKPYQSLAALTSVRTVFDDNIFIGYAPGGSMSNSKLKWEKTDQINAGFDAGLFEDRISMTLDLYYKKTSDILVNVPVVLSSGYSSQVKNLGDMQNKGFEFTINSRIIDGTFSWNLGANISANRNKVLSLPEGGDIFGESIGYVLPSMSLVREGYPVGVFFGYVEDGLTETGQIKYVDVTPDGNFTTADRTIIGDPNPDFIFGINSDISYKNFDLTLLVNSVQGNDILNYNAVNLADAFSYGLNQFGDVIKNSWSAENPDPNAKYPKISKNTRFQASDRFIEDGSYIQLKTVRLSYTLRGGKFESSPLRNSQVYFSAQNLYTFTKYSFYSPIQNTYGAGISKGIDQYGYPDTRSFMVGVIINL